MRVAVLTYDRETDETKEALSQRVGTGHWGTGDAFASVLTGALVRGAPIDAAVLPAMRFVVTALRANEAVAPGHRSVGLLVERALQDVMRDA